MSKVHFAPNSAIRYIGKERQEFSTSLARPKPILEHGDIVIVDKRTAFNLTHKGFGEFEMVEEIDFSQAKAEIVTSESKGDAKKGVLDQITDKLLGK